MINLRIYLILAALLAFSSPAVAQPSVAELVFHKLQALAGEWTGADAEGRLAKTSFKVEVGNTAVLETLAAGGMEEMLTLYSVDGDGIVLVHYCPTNNQPRMRAVPAKGDVKELVFSFQGATNLPTPGTGHEHRLVLQFQDDNHIIERWTWRKNDRESETVYRFARQRN